MNIPNYPSPEAKEIGERLSSALINASVRKAMHGLGGCKEFVLADFDADLHPYIQAYLEGENDSVALIYAAMKTKELTQHEPELEPHFVHLTGQEGCTLDPQELADALADDLVAGEEVTEEVVCYWVLPKRKMWVTVTNEIDGNNRVVWRWV